MKSLGLYIAVFVAYFWSGISAFPPPTFKEIPPSVTAGEARGVWTSNSRLPFDGPKIDIVNQTSFDWWYFDAVSSDGSSHVVVNFYTSDISTLGFPPLLNTTTFVQFTTKFKNGSIYEQVFPANGASIATKGDGSSGRFEGSGATWVGSPSMSQYTVNLDVPALGIKGHIKLRKNVQSHYPCDLATSGVSQQLPGLENIGWANAVPDSEARVDIRIGDYHVKFGGYGYHDKNWGTRPLPSAVYSWYWGHAHIGPYSVVYFDIVNADLSEHVCGYLAKGEQIISKTCTKNVTARPTGGNATFPPTAASDVATGFHLDFSTGAGKFTADLAGAVVWVPQLPYGGYSRWAGKATGGFEGKKLYTGAAVYEWIRFMD